LLRLSFQAFSTVVKKETEGLRSRRFDIILPTSGSLLLGVLGVDRWNRERDLDWDAGFQSAEETSQIAISGADNNKEAQEK
jgi:hypothetical protein